MKLFRKVGSNRLPLSRKLLVGMGVFPIIDHYYEPLFDPRHLNERFSEPRDLPGIDWNEHRQLDLLRTLAQFAGECRPLPSTAFAGSDADIWHGIIRHFRPKRIIEVGSGFSTRIALAAIENCSLTCIEPYEMPWLESAGLRLIRERVENVPRELFKELQANDILFIDSSHVIRPQGDVLTEILEIVPSLKSGVIVHFHDIFSPRHYRENWVIDEVRLWNEQYLLEAFLTHNSQWEILCALNYLQHNHRDDLLKASPNGSQHADPGSFYIRRL